MATVFALMLEIVSLEVSMTKKVGMRIEGGENPLRLFYLKEVKKERSVMKKLKGLLSPEEYQKLSDSIGFGGE